MPRADREARRKAKELGPPGSRPPGDAVESDRRARRRAGASTDAVHAGRSRWTALLTVAAIVVAVARAIALSWTSDDAYISFRYARNLNEGLGLVYNAGERVEGYSNFLWTLWSALGLRLGFAPEAWTHAWGIACFAMTIAILGGLVWRRVGSGAPGWLPFSALALAAHRDMCVFATGGLETAAFTMLAVAGYAALEGLGREPRQERAGLGLHGDAARSMLAA